MIGRRNKQKVKTTGEDKKMKTTMQFATEMFTATQWDTVETKREFCERFVRFVRSGYNPNIFTTGFYKRLSMTFGNIAHYNRMGFYEEQFGSMEYWRPDSINNTERRARFLSNCVNHGGTGDPAWTYSDCENVLARWIQETGQLARESQKLNDAIRDSEMVELHRLESKYRAPVEGA
jgi:hypothetical protein